MADNVSALFSLVVEIAGEVGFSFDEPNGHLNDDGVWHYELETGDEYGWILTGPGDDAFETSYTGWGDITIEPFRLVPFVNQAVAGSLTPHSGTLGGMLGLDLEVGELEDHLIAVYCEELEHLGGDASEWQDLVPEDPLDEAEGVLE